MGESFDRSGSPWKVPQYEPFRPNQIWGADWTILCIDHIRHRTGKVIREKKMSKRIVALGGDGVGPEVTDVACNILENMELEFDILKPPGGESAIEKNGTPFPDETKRLCEDASAVLFGAAGSFSIPIGDGGTRLEAKGKFV